VPPSLPPPPVETQPELTRAASLGRYTVLGMVGKGAMGEVYAAYDPELDRKIAIKLLRVRSGSGSNGDGRIRLMREAQAIAKLSHPNVVTVYDVGAFENDVFIAMQFVDGHTVGYWMHAAPRAWPEVLKVFADAGRGLAAAHAKDLIHRDFKPENVMISPDGNVRVMDFGLARGLLDRDDDVVSAVVLPPPAPATHANDIDLDSTRAVGPEAEAFDPKRGGPNEALNIRITQTGVMLGTPAYMSPEQFRGLQVDARSDQFSFCTALYEALYGERPFPGRSLSDLTASVLKGEVRPPPPRARVPSWVRRIVLRGLKENPDDRWPSMQALVAELDRTRTGAPRRRFAAGAAAKLDGIWEAPSRGRVGETATKAAIRRAFLATGKKYAEAAFQKVSLILDDHAASWTAMYVDACEATHVRGEQSAEVLDLRMASLDESLDSLRALSRAFREANAEVVENAVSAASALGNLERCADVKLLRAVLKPPDDPTTRAAVDDLRTRLAELRVLCHVGRLTEALALCGPLEAEVRHTGYGPLLAEMLVELGNLQIERLDTIAAAVALEEAVWTAELSRHDEVTAKASAQLVYAVGYAQLRFDAGEIWSQLAETMVRRMGGNEYLWGWLFNNRGAMRERQGRLTEAVEDARRAVAVKERVYGPDSADVALSLGNLAIYLEQCGDVETAVRTMERAVKSAEVVLGPDHPTLARFLSNYGEILNRMERFPEAAVVSARALAIAEGESARDDVLSYPLTALGIAYLGEGKPDQALPVLERASAMREGSEIDSSSAGEVHFALARALHQTGGDTARARDLAVRSRAEYARDSPTAKVSRALEQITVWLTSADDRGPIGDDPGCGSDSNALARGDARVNQPQGHPTPVR